MIKHSLQKRLSVIYGIIIIVLVSLSAFTALSLATLSDSVQNITQRQTPTIKSINEALLAVNTASNAISFSMQKNRFKDLADIQRAEAEFNQAVIQYNIFSYALLLGSDNSDFKEVHGGILYQQWDYLGYSRSIMVPEVNEVQKSALMAANELFNDFVGKSQDAFALKKRFLRLEIDDVNNERNQVEQELIVVSQEIQDLVIQVSSQMQALAQRSERLVQEDANILQLQLAALSQSLVVLGVIALLIIITNVWFLRKSIIGPIQKLSKAVEQIIHGDLSQRVSIKSKDEIGVLAHSFNAMTSKLEKSHAELEDKVKEKTEELAEKVLEFEKMNKLMVGRELRMVELKQQIKKAQERLAKQGEPSKVEGHSSKSDQPETSSEPAATLSQQDFTSPPAENTASSEASISAQNSADASNEEQKKEAPSAEETS